MLQKLEDERRADLIRCIRNAEVEEGKVDLDCIAGDHLELVGVAQVLDTLGHFSDHPRIDLNRYDFLAPFEQRRR